MSKDTNFIRQPIFGQLLSFYLYRTLMILNMFEIGFRNSLQVLNYFKHPNDFCFCFFILLCIKSLEIILVEDNCSVLLFIFHNT